ncbi:hypothetical protein B7494_g3975 [Chlorociboria aeruginascens]|nr:hypothetical protein B7494_g3975 [Chlorociboria aeruginascens]
MFVSKSPPPFSIRILTGADKDSNNVAASNADDLQFLSLLPAAYRTESDDLASPYLDLSYFEKELDLQRITKVSHWLWIVGRPMPPRPLHYQHLLGREIFVSEQLDEHLVWKNDRIILKPIPRFLLEPHFWTDYLSCPQNCLCDKTAEADSRRDSQECRHRRLYKCALGFLFSYAALILHESDFFIAKEKHLLPEEIKWLAWKKFVQQILNTEDIYHNIDERFIYGELRLSRLNKIYRLSQGTLARGYISHWHQYGSFFADNFKWLAAAVTYIAIVLTAMQVGLATKSLNDNNAFQSASYGFTVFSILGPLAAVGFISLAFGFMFINNLIVTSDYRKKRLHAIRAGAASS